MPPTPAAPAPQRVATLHTTITDTTAPRAGGAAVHPLVLLHGVFMDSSLWDQALPLLTGSRVITVDMPSHGASTDLPAGSSLDDHVSAVAATLDALGVHDAVMVGHSWGGMVALRLSHTRADLVAGLVLSNTPLLRVRGATRVGFHLQRLLLAAGLSPATYGRIAAGALIGAAHRTANPAAVDALAERTQRMGRRRVRDTLRSVLLEPGDALHLVESLPVPWTLVAGADDYALSAPVRAALTPSGRVHVARGGHATALEDPDALAEATRALMADLAAPVRRGSPCSERPA